jgi:hypothetical protein
MVGQLEKLVERIHESDTDRETKDAYQYILTSVSVRYLSHIQRARRVHSIKSDPPTVSESSSPTSPIYLPETELMASPLGPSTPAALPIDEDTEHAKQSFTTCCDEYYLIHKRARDSAWYRQGPSYATHFGETFSHCLNYLDPSLLCYDNHHRWVRPQ